MKKYVAEAEELMYTNSNLARVSELQYSQIPKLEKEVAELEQQLKETEGNRMLREEVT